MSGPESHSPTAAYEPASPFAEAAFPRWLRAVMTTVGAGLVGLLITAAFLTPSPSGMGTHRQLGLPACASTQLFGVRCPSCGMTTSWAYLVRGRLIASQQANTGGMLLGLTSMFAGPWLFLSGLRGRWVGVIPREWVVVAVGVGIILTTLGDWAFRLMNR